MLRLLMLFRMLLLMLRLLPMLLLIWFQLLLLLVAVSVCGALVAQTAQTQREMRAGERANGDELVLEQRQKDAKGAWREGGGVCVCVGGCRVNRNDV